MGPLEATKPWSMKGVSGVRNFLDRAWRMIVDDRDEQMALAAEVQDVEPTVEQNRILHRTIQEVTQDAAEPGFQHGHRADDGVCELLHQAITATEDCHGAVHAAAISFRSAHREELWQVLGHEKTLAYESWPTFDEAMIKEDTVEIPVQFGKKVRARIRVPADCSREQLEEAARSNPEVAALLDGKQVIKVFVVPGRLVNFTVK